MHNCLRYLIASFFTPFVVFISCITIRDRCYYYYCVYSDTSTVLHFHYSCQHGGSFRCVPAETESCFAVFSRVISSRILTVFKELLLRFLAGIWKCVKYTILRGCIRGQPGSSRRVSAPVQVTKDNSTAKGSDQCSHLYAVHNLATAAVASSPCMHLFQTGVRVARVKLNVASACVFVVLYLNAASLGKHKVLGLPLVVK